MKDTIHFIDYEDIGNDVFTTLGRDAPHIMRDRIAKKIEGFGYRDTFVKRVIAVSIVDDTASVIENGGSDIHQIKIDILVKAIIPLAGDVIYDPNMHTMGPQKSALMVWGVKNHILNVDRAAYNVASQIAAVGAEFRNIPIPLVLQNGVAPMKSKSILGIATPYVLNAKFIVHLDAKTDLTEFEPYLTKIDNDLTRIKVLSLQTETYTTLVKCFGKPDPDTKWLRKFIESSKTGNYERKSISEYVATKTEIDEYPSNWHSVTALLRDYHSHIQLFKILLKYYKDIPLHDNLIALCMNLSKNSSAKQP